MSQDEHPRCFDTRDPRPWVQSQTDLLAEMADRDLPAESRGLYGLLERMAGLYDRNGSIFANEAQLSRWTGKDRATFERDLAPLIAAGLVEQRPQGELHVVRWNEEQPIMTPTKRRREERRRKKATA